MSITEATRARKIAARYTADPETRSWLWTGATRRGGYGTLTVDYIQLSANRYMYEKHKGLIPDGLEIGHSCETPACVNPAHLEAVTHLENMRRIGCKSEEFIMGLLELGPLGPTEIGRILGKSYDHASSWACQVLKRLLECGRVIRENRAGSRRVIYRRARWQACRFQSVMTNHCHRTFAIHTILRPW